MQHTLRAVAAAEASKPNRSWPGGGGGGGGGGEGVKSAGVGAACDVAGVGMELTCQFAVALPPSRNTY